MDHIIFWNARGAGSNKFTAAVKDLVKLNKISFLVICEPKIQFSKAKDFFTKLGFNGNIINEACGYSGGIWILWKEDNFSVTLIDSHFQAITIQIESNFLPTWTFSAIYASPINSSRIHLWDHLDSVVSNIPFPWLAVGDFNELLNYSDKIGGAASYRFGGMKNWVCRNGMIDLGYHGAPYTWTNNSVKERLDRGFCNPCWRIAFPEAIVIHLARIKSDHCPIMVKLSTNNPNTRKNMPFRFQAMWLGHNNFPEILKHSWNSNNADLLQKSAILAKNLQQWNKNVFGNIFKQKKVLLARICGIQRSLGLAPNPFLTELEKTLTAKYYFIRDAESLFWKQKSRDKWLKDGDRNTKFFHLTTIIRRRRNKIMGLHDNSGSICAEPAKMQQIAIDFFKNLFSTPNDPRYDLNTTERFLMLSTEDLNTLSRPVVPQEIKDCLFQIGRLKAPGHDGFPAAFFQDQWTLCAPDIIKYVSTIFDEATIPPGLNHTIIALVPKTTSPQDMNLFRPISLCCTIYKVISKIIVARLRPYLCDWISPNQVSYVPGRHIADNIMIVQELIHKFRHAQGKKGFIAWKIDLSKAYDRLRWDFIQKTLTELHLPQKLIKMIMSCITSTSFQISINGELTDTFTGNRGIRQGDPLSPYLFVICMEKLSHLIQDKVDASLWKPVKATRYGPLISHLFFADDLILFSEASPQQARI